MLTENTLVILAALTTYAFAKCPMPSNPAVGLNGSPDGGKTVNNDKVCQPQGAGSWTFVMQSSAVDVPSGGAGGIEGGYSGGTVFAILDNTCAIKNVYDQPGCGTPYTITESFLPYPLIVKEIFDDDYFEFKYGDTKYSIGKNHCKCHNVSKGLEGVTSCMCAFPVDGKSNGKRDTTNAFVSVPFEA
ncbi:hypothetical protein ACLMJK_006338 [Lecanora helva]